MSPTIELHVATGYQSRMVPDATGNRPPCATPSSERASTRLVNTSPTAVIKGEAAVRTLATTVISPKKAIVARAPNRWPKSAPGS